MKAFVCLVVAVVICIAVWKLLEYANSFFSSSPAPATVSSEAWPPLNPKIACALAGANKKGPA